MLTINRMCGNCPEPRDYHTEDRDGIFWCSHNDENTYSPFSPIGTVWDGDTDTVFTYRLPQHGYFNRSGERYRGRLGG